MIFVLIMVFLAANVTYAQLGEVSTNAPTEVTAGRSVYKWEIKRLILENTNGVAPFIVQGDSTLRANTIIYDDKAEIGYAYGRVNYQNLKDRTVLTCGEGSYDTKKKEIIARKNPRIVMQKDNVTAKSDIIKIYSGKDYTLLLGNVWITNKQFTMEGDQATFFQKQGKFKLLGNAKAKQKDTTLYADKIDADSRDGQMDSYTAQGHVNVIDTKGDYNMRSGRLDYYKELGYTKMTKNPYLYFSNQNIYAYSIVMEKYDDEDKANLLGDVIILQGNKKIYAKWGEYYTKTKSLILTGNPIMVQGNSRFNTSRIEVDVEAGTMNMIGTGTGYYEYKTNR